MIIFGISINIVNADTPYYHIEFTGAVWQGINTDGTIISSNADFETVFNDTLSIMKDSSYLYIDETVTLTHYLTISKKVNIYFTKIISTTDTTLFYMNNLTNIQGYLNVEEIIINADLSNTTSIIYMPNSWYNDVNIGIIRNDYATRNGNAIELFAGNGNGAMANNIRIYHIVNFNNGILILTTNDGWIAENNIEKTAIVYCNTDINITQSGSGGIFSNNFYDLLLNNAYYGLKIECGNGNIEQNMFRNIRCWDFTNPPLENETIYTYYANANVSGTLFSGSMMRTDVNAEWLIENPINNGVPLIHDEGTQTKYVADWQPLNQVYYSNLYTSTNNGSTQNNQELFLEFGIVLAIVFLIVGLVKKYL